MQRNLGLAFLIVVTLVMLAATADAAGIITSVTDVSSDAAITNGVTSQRENDLGAVIVPFGEDVFCYTDRSHQYNGARFTAAGVLTATNPPVAGDVTIGLPAYLLGGEYVSTRNNNRDNAAPFSISVAVGPKVSAYLLLDNRLGDNVNTDPAVLGSGGTGLMAWVADEGWVRQNTGISPNGQPDYGAIDEGGTITDFLARPNPNTNLGVGPGVLINNFWTVYKKDFPAGSTITLKEQNGGGYNMYGLVVKQIPEPSSIIMLVFGAIGLGLAALRRRLG